MGNLFEYIAISWRVDSDLYPLLFFARCYEMKYR